MSVWLNAAAAAADIRDIRGPISVPPQTPWLVYALCVLAAPLLWWALRRSSHWLRARRRVPTAYELAKARLASADAHMEQQKPDAFAEQVSNAVRHYVEARFELPVTHRTSEEFLSELLAREDVSPVLLSKRGELSEFLETCDLAKFAARSLQRETMRALSSAARRFIDAAETAPTGASS